MVTPSRNSSAAALLFLLGVTKEFEALKES